MAKQRTKGTGFDPLGGAPIAEVAGPARPAAPPPARQEGASIAGTSGAHPGTSPTRAARHRSLSRRKAKAALVTSMM